MRVRGKIVHDAAIHQRLRRDERRWQKLPLVGFQHYDADEDVVVELRNCSCGSTLGRRVRRQSP